MMKNTKQKALSAIKRVKDKVIDKTSDALSLPKRSKHKAEDMASQRRYETFKAVNDMKGVKDRGNASDPLFRGRNMMKDAQRKALKSSMAQPAKSVPDRSIGKVKRSMPLPASRNVAPVAPKAPKTDKPFTPGYKPGSVKRGYTKYA